jgi:acyl carrier protein
MAFSKEKCKMNIKSEEIKNRIAEVLNISVERFNDDTILKDLVTDSFLLVEMAIELQEDFQVRFSQEDLKEVGTIGDLIFLIKNKKSNS